MPFVRRDDLLLNEAMFSALARSFRAFPQRHPVLWQALLWSLPALVFGLVLRGLLLSYSPYAYWGSDSRSYFGFTSGLLNDFQISLNEKRRYLYPLLLFPVTLLPGPTLRWVAILQAALGLISVLPVAYVVRRVFAGWRFWILPTTLIYTGLPIFLWYEHEMLAECLFYCAIVWSIGGWTAWILAPAGARKARLWWCFFAAVAVLLLTKPAGRFLVPGLLLGFLAVRGWRYLRWREVLAAGAVLGLTATMGDDEQGAWLLYTSAFPFTQLESPKHADYKAQVADLVRYSRADLMRFADTDNEVFLFLRDPTRQDDRPLWKELGKDHPKLAKLYSELALEAIKAEPLGFLSLSLNRVLASANPEEFELDRFDADYFEKRFADAYQRQRNPVEMLQLAFAFPRGEPLPPLDWFRSRINPSPHSTAAAWLQAYCAGYERAGRLFGFVEPGNPRSSTSPWPTPFGWFVLASALVALLGSFRTLGVWLIVAGSYLVGVFLVGVQHPRYFAVVWPVVILILPALPDALWRWFTRPSQQFGGGLETQRAQRK